MSRLSLLVLASTACSTWSAPVAEEADPALSREPVPQMLVGLEADRSMCWDGQAGSVTATGRVLTSDQRPVPHAVISVLDPETLGWTPVDHTDADGRYRFTVDGPAVYTVANMPSQPGELCAARPAHPPAVDAAPIELPDADLVSKRATAAVDVRFVDDRGGPIADREVWFSSRPLLPLERTGVHTDADGRATISVASTDGAFLGVDHPDLTVRSVKLQSGQTFTCPTPGSGDPTPCAPTDAGPLTIELGPGVVFQGQVLAADSGAPLVGAVVDGALASATTWTDADGRYRLVLPEADRAAIHVSYPGYSAHDWRPSRAQTPQHPGAIHLADDVVLEPTRSVQARCAGLDEAQCRGLFLQCAAAGELTAPFEAPDLSIPRRVTCPAWGDAVVSASGVQVKVPSTDEVAWLDFRGITGGVTGSLPDQVSCRGVTAIGANPGLGDGLGIASRSTSCQDNRFALDALTPGVWNLTVHYAPSQGGRTATWETAVTVRDDVEDLGVLDLPR